MSISRHPKHQSRRMVALAIALLIGAAPLISGLLVMDYQLNKRLEQSAKIAVDEALFTFDRLFDGLRAAAVLALPSGTRPCQDIQNRLAAQVAGNPRLQSLIVNQGAGRICRSMETMELPDFAPDQTLRLIFDSTAIPDGALVAYRLVNGDRSVVATTYGLEIRNELRAFKNGLRLIVEIGDQYIWTEGDSREQIRPSMSEFLEGGVSKKYGYRIKVGYPQGFTAAEARQARNSVLPSLVLISALTSAVVIWSLRNRRVNTDGKTASRRPAA